MIRIDDITRQLNLDQALAYLLCPEDRDYNISDWEAIFRKVPLTCVFGDKVPTHALHNFSDTPILVAADLEHGAGSHLAGCQDFPWPFAIGAANSLKLAEQMGKSTAMEAIEHGVQWTFSPCVDLSINHNNPVVNIRSLGDNPERVAKLASVWINSMQKGGLAACAKHFPGDGVDDRDQHLCTSVNSLSREEWWKTYGQIWRKVIRAGVMSIMSGHISLPAFQSKVRRHADALPATLSSELQINLLRRQLGFDGVIVSDAAPMIGLTSRVPSKDAVVENVLAGSDVFLFADPIEDFGRLKAAVKRGRLSESRILESVRRIVAMRIKIGLYNPVSKANRKGVAFSKQKARFATAATQMAEKSVVLFKKNHVTPLKLKSGSKIALVILRYENGSKKFSSDLPVVHQELEARGFIVSHWVNPSHHKLQNESANFDAVFVNFVVVPHALIGTVRLIGSAVMPLWRSFWNESPNVIFTSFGSPYHIYELPHLPNYWITGSISEVSQQAIVRAWLGEIEAKGRCPIKLPISP